MSRRYEVAQEPEIDALPGLFSTGAKKNSPDSVNVATAVSCISFRSCDLCVRRTRRTMPAATTPSIAISLPFASRTSASSVVRSSSVRPLVRQSQRRVAEIDYFFTVFLSMLLPITAPAAAPMTPPTIAPFTLFLLVVAPMIAPATAPIFASRSVFLMVTVPELVGAGEGYTVPLEVPLELGEREPLVRRALVPVDRLGAAGAYDGSVAGGETAVAAAARSAA